jgi:aminoglycoside phosphotransferase
MVMLSDPKIIKELASTEENIMSFAAAGAEVRSSSYVRAAEMLMLLAENLRGVHLLPRLAKHPYHMEITKSLTNRLSSILPEIMSELVQAFEANTNIRSDWTTVDNFDVMLKCISRTTNRLFGTYLACPSAYFADEEM